MPLRSCSDHCGSYCCPQGAPCCGCSCCPWGVGRPEKQGGWNSQGHSWQSGPVQGGLPLRKGKVCVPGCQAAPAYLPGTLSVHLICPAHVSASMVGALYSHVSKAGAGMFCTCSSHATCFSDICEQSGCCQGFPPERQGREVCCRLEHKCYSCHVAVFPHQLPYCLIVFGDVT
jgi:hypothetical protein